MMRIGVVAGAGLACDGVGLTADEAHLWSAPDDICEGVPSLLPPDERARAARFISEKAARSFAAGRTLARLALSSHYPVRPQDWAFAPGPNGRPFIIAPEKYRDVQFSISHTEGLVACLTSRIAQAAVDVERVTAWDDLSFVAPTILSTAEQRSIEQLADETWLRRFFDYWTLKEAYAKALGDGLGYDFSSVSFDFGPGSEVAARFADGVGAIASHWLFRRLALGSVWAGAVAVRTGPSGTCRLVHAELTSDLRVREVSQVFC